jgi:hypothetical protein
LRPGVNSSSAARLAGQSGKAKAGLEPVGGFEIMVAKDKPNFSFNAGSASRK